MEKILMLIQECEISKVALANYFDVSRQMIYNYLNFDKFEQWPMRKRVMLLDLFGVNNSVELETLKVTPKLINDVKNKLNISSDNNDDVTLNNLESRYKVLITDLIRLCSDDETKEAVYNITMLLEYALVNNEYMYLIEYLAKVFKNTKTTEFKYNEKEQMAFEGIMYSAFNLYSSKKYNEDKVRKAHKEFVKDINSRSQHDLQSTSSINFAKIIAKKELGIDVIDEGNVDQVLEKVLEIQNRKK